jgi:tetratricopeptide (TPR) repeat protein
VRARLAIGLLLVALVGAVYAQVRHHEFVNYDDWIYVLENPGLRQGLSADSLTRAFEPYENNWIPLTWISLQLDHAVWGTWPGGFLLTNVALHAASAVLLFLALLRATGALGCSAFSAAIFAAHPLHVESVAWASERKDALSGLFFCLALLLHVAHARRPDLLRWLAVAASTALGLMAKPMLVTLPFVLLLLDYWPLRRLGPAQGGDGAGGGIEPGALRRALLEKLPLFAMAAGVAWVTFTVQRATGAMAGDEILPLGWRVANALDAQLFYLAKSVWPSGLGAFYPHPGADLPLWRPILAGALLLALSVAALRQLRRRPPLAVGWLWYAGMMLPVSGLVQVGLQARADRYAYLPSIGLTVALVWSLAGAFGGTRRGRIGLTGAGSAAVAALAVVAWLQVGHWKDTRALFARAVAVTPANYLAHQALATLLLHDGRPAEAMPHFEEALRIKPGWPAAHFGLAEALAEAGDPEAALGRFEAGLRLAPRNPDGRTGYARALAQVGRHDDAIHHYLRALRVARGRRAARAHGLLARSLEAQGNLAAALEHYGRAVALEPGWGEAHANRGAALLRAGRPDEAEQAFERAQALGVDSLEMRLARAETARLRGRTEEAVLHYREALRLEPDSLQAANNLSWILATHPSERVRDPEAAVRIASRLPADEPAALDTLAAGYAAAGRFDDARAAARRGAELAEARGDGALALAIRRRLDLYERRRPYLEPGRAEAEPP